MMLYFILGMLNASLAAYNFIRRRYWVALFNLIAMSVCIWAIFIELKKL